MTELYDMLRGMVANLRFTATVSEKLPAKDAIETGQPLKGSVAAVSGHTCIIDYRDAKGAGSTRQVSCVRLESSDSKQYLSAWCHARNARRVFIIESIEQVYDIETGEALGSGISYFARFTPDSHLSAGWRWGLPPKLHADLIAGLNTLVFLARCDGHSHHNEREEIETFTAAWWMRNDISDKIPDSEIMAATNKLAPDAETFVLALDRISANIELRQLVAGYAKRLIEADGILHGHELYWMRLVEEQLTIPLS